MGSCAETSLLECCLLSYLCIFLKIERGQQNDQNQGFHMFVCFLVIFRLGRVRYRMVKEILESVAMSHSKRGFEHPS